VQPRGDKSNIGKIKDLSPVRQGESPELRSRSEDVNETFAGTRGDFGAEWDADEV